MHLNKLPILLFFILGSICCQLSDKNNTETTNHFDSAAKNDHIIVKQQTISIESPKNDSVTTFKVDDYPVSNEMLKNNCSLKKSGEIVSLDKAWFCNDSLQQTLVFDLYTDYHRIVTYHFYNNNIPPDLINRMELNIDGGELASEKQKTNDIKGLLTQAKKVNSSYFTTLKSFKLGDSKEKAIKIYGEPSKKTNNNDYEKIEWEFVGDITFENSNDEVDRKPIAENSFGHQVIMYFKNDKLKGVILHNDIP